MKKIYLFLVAVTATVALNAALPYNTVMTEAIYNSSKVNASGDNAWVSDKNGFRCGGSSAGAFSSPAWNWDDKYVDFVLASGVPDQLSFNYQGNDVASTGVEYYVSESADGKNFTQIWNTTSNSVVYPSNAITLTLSPTTRYLRFCFSGNFAGYFENIKVTEKILMGTPSAVTLDFGTVYVDDVVEPQSFTLNWTNLEGAAVPADEHFAVTPENFGYIGGYQITTTFEAVMLTNEAGEFASTIDLAGRGKSASVAVSGTVIKHEQTIAWDLPESVYGNAVLPLASASSDLECGYEFAPEGIVDYVDGALVILGEGEVTITAKQEGNYKYNGAEQVVKTLTVIAAIDQEITWEEEQTYSYTVGQNIAYPMPTASSELEVSVVIEPAENVEIVEEDGVQMIVFLKEGEVTITATQAGNDMYNAAEPIVRTYTITGMGSGLESVLQNSTDKARKMIYNGAVYIVRDNQLFDLTGRQVR